MLAWSCKNGCGQQTKTPSAMLIHAAMVLRADWCRPGKFFFLCVSWSILAPPPQPLFTIFMLWTYSCSIVKEYLSWPQDSCALVWGFLTTFTTQLMILVRDTSPQLPVHKQNKTNSLSFCPWLTQTGSCSLPQQDYSWNQHTSESPAWLILTGSRYSLYTSQYLHSKT